ncbi:hypothetical protein AAXE64_27985 [Priestia megaterium]
MTFRLNLSHIYRSGVKVAAYRKRESGFYDVYPYMNSGLPIKSLLLSEKEFADLKNRLTKELV